MLGQHAPLKGLLLSEGERHERAGALQSSGPAADAGKQIDHAKGLVHDFTAQAMRRTPIDAVRSPILDRALPVA